MKNRGKIQPLPRAHPGARIGLIPLSDPRGFSCAGNGATGDLSFGAANLFL